MEAKGLKEQRASNAHTTSSPPATIGARKRRTKPVPVHNNSDNSTVLTGVGGIFYAMYQNMQYLNNQNFYGEKTIIITKLQIREIRPRLN